jgi:hypothetical protein
MFGTGMATANHASSNYNSIFLSEVKGTTRNAEGLTNIVNVGFFSDPGVVSIKSYSISPKSAAVGSTIGLYISALNYKSLWAKVIAPNSQEQIINLLNEQTINFLPTPSIVGTYNVTFYANSSTGAIASIIDSFELTEAIAEPTPSAGGYCEYIWDCTSWGICLDGKQIRECKNTGTCSGTNGKPIEERICSDALFDVILKFEDLELTENETLEFNISLIETKGIEKIDVQIRYTIIDGEGNEIFNQIETRAIQGELTYEKEIVEVKLIDGEYTLKVDILYGNLQRAFAEQKFKVELGELELEIPFKERIFTEEFLIIFGSLLFLIILIMLISIVIWIKVIKRKKKGRKKREGEYKGRVKKNLKRIRSKTLIITIFGFIIIGLLFIAKKGIAGLVVFNQLREGSWTNIAGTILITGLLVLLVFLSRNKIKDLIEKI